jgi:hypothetical protein
MIFGASERSTQKLKSWCSVVRNDVFNYRPLAKESIQYCMQDVQFLLRLWARYAEGFVEPLGGKDTHGYRGQDSVLPERALYWSWPAYGFGSVYVASSSWCVAVE